MSLEPLSKAVEKATHPIATAVAVVAIVLLAATAYTFAISSPGVSTVQSVEARSPSTLHNSPDAPEGR